MWKNTLPCKKLLQKVSPLVIVISGVFNTLSKIHESLTWKKYNFKMASTIANTSFNIQSNYFPINHSKWLIFMHCLLFLGLKLWYIVDFTHRTYSQYLSQVPGRVVVWECRCPLGLCYIYLYLYIQIYTNSAVISRYCLLALNCLDMDIKVEKKNSFVQIHTYLWR